jgi:hypothetical protein
MKATDQTLSSSASAQAVLGARWPRRAVLAACAGLAGGAFAATASVSASTSRAEGASDAGVPPELLQAWSRRPYLQGEGRLRFLGLLIYDVRLWTEGPGLDVTDWARRPLALEITYARGFDARQIAETNLAVIMGRISAYTGDMVKFDDLLKHEKSPYYNLKASVSPLDFEKGTVKLPTEVPSVPGKA